VDFAQQGNRFNPTIFPVDALDWLESHPQEGEVFNYFPWGGYVLYRAWPQMDVFIDGQTDFYGEALTREYETVLSLAPGWQTVLDDYMIAWVIFPADAKLVAQLNSDSGWAVVYHDETAVILHRR